MAVLPSSNPALEGVEVSEEHTGAAKQPEPLASSTRPVLQSHDMPEELAPLVLIAEDEEPIAEAVAWVVEELGYTPLIAHNGREALALTISRRPTLLITDWMMPLLDGVGLIRAVKQQAAQDGVSSIPIILMTAARLPAPAAAEADAVLPKPFEINELEALIQRFMSPPQPE